MTNYLGDTFCVECGERLDAASALDDGSGPCVDDFTLCLYCGALLVFVTVDPQTLRLPTPEERREFAAHAHRPAAESIVKRFTLKETDDE